MFDGATNFNNGDAPGLSNSPLGWDTSKVINMRQMFGSTSSFNQDIGSWQTGAVKDMYLMFINATVFNQDIGNWQTGNVTNMGGMFTRASAFNQDISSWQTGNVTNMASMFLEASAFNQNIGGWNTGNVKYMQSMFQKATAFNNGETPGESNHTMDWDTKNVGSMANMFSWASSFNQNIGNWNTGTVTSMVSMFRNAIAFNNGEAPGESNHTMNWDTKNVTSMASMFQDAKVFNQNIGSWDTSKVSTMIYLFSGATNFNNGDAPGESHHTMNWSSGSLESMAYMFYRAEAFNQPFGSNWNTASVTNMSYVFRDAKRFNQNISNWQTGNVTDMSYMFGYATAFNQPIGGWDTSKVTNMMYMFNNATSFNQDISNWNVSKVERISYFLNNTAMHPYNYDALLTDWSAQTVKPNLYMDAVGVYYCHAGDARNTLTSPPKNWRINDAGLSCPPQNLSLSQTEIEENKTEVGTISATTQGVAIYSLVPGEGSEDNSKFALNPTTGLLAFLEAPDYENPTGSGDSENDPTNKNKYSIRVRATDTTNLYSEKVFIITVKDVDDVPPVINIVAPGNKMSKAPINVSFTVSDRYSVNLVEKDSSSVATIDNLSCTPPFPADNTAENPEQNHLVLNCTINVTSSGKLVIKATDKAGYSSTESMDGFVIDTTPPTFITSSINTLTHGIDNPVVEFEATDAVGIQKYEIKYVGSDGLDKVDEIQYVEPGVITRTLNLNPAEDQHTITIIAYDLVGNTTEKKTIFPPEVIFNAPTIISNQPINNSTVTITTPVTGHEINNITISGTASEGVTLENCADASGEHDAPYVTSVTCNIRNINKSGTLTIQAEDTTNGATGYNSQMYTIDTVKPNIIISAPTKAKNGNITNTTIAVTDDIEIYPEDIEIDSGSSGMAQNLVCTADAGDQNIINCTVTITNSGDLKINAKDKAGNSFSRTEEDYIVDTKAPIVKITTGTPINKTNQTHYLLEGTCTEGDNNVVIIIAKQPYTTACLVDGTWSTELDLSAQPDGTVQVYVSQTDAVGNKGEDSKDITKDIIVPIADFDTLLTKEKSPELTGLVNDATAVVRVEVAGKIYNADNNGDGTWKLDAGSIDPELADGTYTVSVIVTDTALNKGTYDFTDALAVDATSPTITINAPTKISNKNIEDIVITVIDNNEVIAEDVSINSSSTGGPINLVCTQSGTKRVNCTVTVTKSGNLIINSVDQVGNNTSKTEDKFIIDKVVPIVTITNENPINSANQTSYSLEGTCTEGDGDITINTADQPYQTECQISGTWGKTLDLSTLTEGNTSIQATQTDKAGNKGTFTKNLVKDTVAPTITINQSATQADPTNTNSVKYVVVFSEKIDKTTFTNDDISISGSTTAKVKDITEISDTEYEVEIYNLTDGDTITANIPANALTDLATNGNTASTSDDNSVTYKTTTPSSNPTSSKKSKKCRDQAPGKTPPLIYSAVSNNSHSVLLSFSPADEPVEKYVIQYGTKPDSYPHEIKNLGVNSRDTMTYLVNMLSPNTTYYFRIKAVNGCASGKWSNTISAKTKPLLGFNQLDTVSLDITTPHDQPEDHPKCQTYTVKSGDSPWSISEQLFGSGLKFQEIIDQNSDEYPSIKDNLIKPGWILKFNCPQDDKKSDDHTSLESSHPGFKVQVRVVDTKDKPIQNAKVTIHSKVQEALTNSEGIAEFNNVEPGEHKIVINYDNFQGEQSITLDEGSNVKVYRLDIVVKKQKLDISFWFIILLIIIILLLIYRHYKEKQRQQKKSSLTF